MVFFPHTSIKTITAIFAKNKLQEVFTSKSSLVRHQANDASSFFLRCLSVQDWQYQDIRQK